MKPSRYNVVLFLYELYHHHYHRLQSCWPLWSSFPSLTITFYKYIKSKDLTAGQLNSWLSQQKAPVIILHHETPAVYHYNRRSLLNNKSPSSMPSSSISLSASKSAAKELNEFQISQYQICLWTGLVLFLLMLVSICSIINMEIIPDSLLYAKFQSGRTGKSDW